MKRILVILICLTFCIGFIVSCDEENTSSSSVSSTISSKESESESTEESVADQSQESESESTEESTSELIKESTSEPNPDDTEQDSNTAPIEHYTFGSTFSELTGTEVITSYEELIEYTNGKGLCKANLSVPNENNVEFDIHLFENTFEDSFIIVVPHRFSGYEESYYNSIEEYEDGTYALWLILIYECDQMESPIINLDFVIIPWSYYDENMEKNGVGLEEIARYEPTYDIPEDTPYNSKVDNPTKEKLHSMSEGEYISLTVWLYSPPTPPMQGNGVSSTEISARVNSFYSKFNAYKKEHGEIEASDLPIDKLREFSGITDELVMTDTELRSCIESNGGISYAIRIYEINKDTREYRQQVKRANEERNEEFCSLLDMTRCRSVHKDSLLTLISLECDRDYVLTLQEISLVSSINYNNPDEVLIEDAKDA